MSKFQKVHVGAMVTTEDLSHQQELSSAELYTGLRDATELA